MNGCLGTKGKQLTKRCYNVWSQSQVNHRSNTTLWLRDLSSLSLLSIGTLLVVVVMGLLRKKQCQQKLVRQVETTTWTMLCLVLRPLASMFQTQSSRTPWSISCRIWVLTWDVSFQELQAWNSYRRKSRIFSSAKSSSSQMAVGTLVHLQVPSRRSSLSGKTLKISCILSQEATSRESSIQRTECNLKLKF